MQGIHGGNWGAREGLLEGTWGAELGLVILSVVLGDSRETEEEESGSKEDLSEEKELLDLRLWGGRAAGKNTFIADKELWISIITLLTPSPPLFS